MSTNSFSDGGSKTEGYWWHVARGVVVDTGVEPQWLRTGYRYFPYAAWQDRQWWVIRANYGFPEHDSTTLFIDGVVVADTTAGADDARPLVASIGRLSLTRSHLDTQLPMMDPQMAREVVVAVAAFIDHGSERGDPCDWCVFAERDPFALAGDPVAPGRHRPTPPHRPRETR